MSIQNQEEMAGMTRAGAVVQEALSSMVAHVKPGITTAALDAIGAEIFEKYGARSAPKDIYGFPGTNIICINDEIVHGIPGERIIAPGDLVTIDATKGEITVSADLNTRPLPPSDQSQAGTGRELFEVFRDQVSSASLGASIFSGAN